MMDKARKMWLNILSVMLLLKSLHLSKGPAWLSTTYDPPYVQSKSWRECIKKIWEIDAFCPRCGGSMRIISFITENLIIKQMLEHLGLWQQKPSRSPPTPLKTGELVYVPCYDDWPIYSEP